jgi:hypothetical protein
MRKRKKIRIGGRSKPPSGAEWDQFSLQLIVNTSKLFAWQLFFTLAIFFTLATFLYYGNFFYYGDFGDFFRLWRLFFTMVTLATFFHFGNFFFTLMTLTLTTLTLTFDFGNFFFTMASFFDFGNFFEIFIVLWAPSQGVPPCPVGGRVFCSQIPLRCCCSCSFV